MLRFLLTLIGIALMIGLYFAVKAAVGIGNLFGEGLFCGAFGMTLLFWAVWKVDPESFQPSEEFKARKERSRRRGRPSE